MQATFETTTQILALYTDDRRGVLKEACRKKHNIKQSVPNELNLGELELRDHS